MLKMHTHVHTCAAHGHSHTKARTCLRTKARTHVHVQALRRPAAKTKEQLFTFSPQRPSRPLPSPAAECQAAGESGGCTGACQAGGCLSSLMVSPPCVQQHDRGLLTSDGKGDRPVPSTSFLLSLLVP